MRNRPASPLLIGGFLFANLLAAPSLRASQAGSAIPPNQPTAPTAPQGAVASGSERTGNVPSRTASGGASNWTAGRSSFGSERQPGGIWRDLQAPSLAPQASQAANPAPAPFAVKTHRTKRSSAREPLLSNHTAGRPAIPPGSPRRAYRESEQRAGAASGLRALGANRSDLGRAAARNRPGPPSHHSRAYTRERDATALGFGSINHPRLRQHRSLSGLPTPETLPGRRGLTSATTLH